MSMRQAYLSCKFFLKILFRSSDETKKVFGVSANSSKLQKGPVKSFMHDIQRKMIMFRFPEWEEVSCSFIMTPPGLTCLSMYAQNF